MDVDLPVDQLAARLTMSGVTVDRMEPMGPDFQGKVVVGKVLTVNPHPKADRLTLVRWKWALGMCGGWSVVLPTCGKDADGHCLARRPFARRIRDQGSSDSGSLGGMLCSPGMGLTMRKADH